MLSTYNVPRPAWLRVSRRAGHATGAAVLAGAVVMGGVVLTASQADAANEAVQVIEVKPLTGSTENQDWIIIKNLSQGSVNISNYTIRNQVTSTPTTVTTIYTIGNVILNPGESFALSGSGVAPPASTYNDQLGGSGEVVAVTGAVGLYNAAGTPVRQDSVSFSATGAGGATMSLLENALSIANPQAPTPTGSQKIIKNFPGGPAGDDDVNAYDWSAVAA